MRFQLFIFITYLLTFVNAESYIETSSLLTCMRNSQLTASYFNVVYTPNDTTVAIDITGITTVSGKVRAHIQLIVYGLTIMEQNRSLCSMGVKTLCPISAGRLDFSTTYKLSSSITKQIPGVAFTVPDLDAKVKVVVYPEDTSNDTQLACVEALLTNGKTVNTKYASWPIAAISGLGLISSGFFSVAGQTNTAAHIASNSLSLFVYFQNLAITSMMGVDKVPPIAAAWCQNFQWSMGIIHTKFLEKIASWYVQSTGGTTTSILANKDVLSISVQKKFLKRSSYATLRYLSDVYEKSQKLGYMIATPKYEARHKYSRNDNIYIAKRDTSSSQDTLSDTTLYNTNEKNTTALTSKVLVLRGIQRVAYLANMEITSLFFTSMVFTIFFAFVLVVCLTIFKGVVELLIKANAMNDGKFSEYRSQWGSIIKGALYRLFLIGFPQVVVLCIWELTERDSVACVIMAIVLLVIVMTVLVQAAIRLILIGRESVKLYKNPAYSLYGDPKVLNKYGFLYVQYQAASYYWVMISLTYIFLRSLIIAVLQNAGKVQAVIIFIFELVYFVALCVIRPYMDKRTNVFNIMVHLVNLINSVFFLIFSNVFGSKAAVNSISGVVLFVLNAVFSLILLIFTIVTCILAVTSKNPDTKYTPVNDDRVCFIKRADGEEKIRGDTELEALGSAALRGHEEVDNYKTLSYSDKNIYTPNNNQFKDSDSDSDKFPSSRLPTGGNNFPRSESFSSNNVVQPGSVIYNNQSTSSFGTVNRPHNAYSDVNTGYKGMNNVSGHQYVNYNN